jgi:hypothetical protein
VVVGKQVAQNTDQRFAKEWNRQCLGGLAHDVTGAVELFF